jgi:hypothetical protein
LDQDSTKAEMDWLLQLEMGQRNGMEFINISPKEVLNRPRFPQNLVEGQQAVQKKELFTQR